MIFTKINNQLKALTLPPKPDVEQLNELLKFLYPLFLKPAPDNFTANRDEWSCYWKAKVLFEQILYDKHAEDRQRIKESWKKAEKRNKTVHEFLNRYTQEDKEPVSGNPQDIFQQIYDEMEYAPVVQIPYDDIAISKLLAPYFQWIEKELKDDPYIHLPIIWKMLHASQHTIKKAFFKWFTALEEKQLVEPYFGNNMEQAVEWECFIDSSNFLEKTSKKNFDQWLILLDHENPVLRGIAAKCIGNVYTDWQDEDDEFQGYKHIPITQMLDTLYQKQVEGKNVVGGFIDGITTEGAGLYELDKHKVLQLEKFDVKAWVLKTVIDSPEAEPYIPGSQAFWFYIHEYLDYDVKSCHNLIDGKRYWLAMMCATESLNYGSYKVMKTILDRLQQEAPSAIADEIERQVQIYLKHYHKK